MNVYKIFIRKDPYFNKTDVSHNWKEKDLQICAVELGTKASKVITLSLYIAPTRDFNRFIRNIDDTLKYLYKPKDEFVISGHKNTDYFTERHRKKSSLIINI
jgi:hypothetical protein